MIELSTVRDHRGALVFGEVGDHLPFLVKRMFMVLDVPDRKVRGEHAHRELHQLLICIDGSCGWLSTMGSTTARWCWTGPTSAFTYRR